MRGTRYEYLFPPNPPDDKEVFLLSSHTNTHVFVLESVSVIRLISTQHTPGLSKNGKPSAHSDPASSAAATATTAATVSDETSSRMCAEPTPSCGLPHRSSYETRRRRELQ